MGKAKQKKLGRAEVDRYKECPEQRPKEVMLSDMSIVTLAYATKEIIELCLGHGLYFEQADWYTSCFYSAENY